MIRKYFNLVLYLLSLFLLLGCAKKYPHALIITEMDTIEIELYTDRAPVSASNFMRYCKEGRYKNSTFYRAVRMDNQPNNDVKIRVLQGGLFDDDHPKMLPPIIHEPTGETGILHKDGIISLARYEPGTATSEFFICIGDQPSLDFGGNRNPDEQGFAAFGKVVKGMDVVKRYLQMPTDGQYLEPRIKILDIIIEK